MHCNIMQCVHASREHTRTPQLEMAALLSEAHGGVWDARSSQERASLMRAAIHSMTEAGLDEEVAVKVFASERVRNQEAE